MSHGVRIHLLCEDRLTERFLRKLCKRFGVRVVDVAVSPKGKGAASAWVLAQYPRQVRRRTSKNFQPNLGLLVHIDGDDVGLQARKRELDRRLLAAAPPLARPAPGDPVAVFVPTWCTETWLLHLAGIATPPETAQLKRGPNPAYQRPLAVLHADESGVIRRAAEAWPGASSPSLKDAAEEGRRIGLG